MTDQAFGSTTDNVEEPARAAPEVTGHPEVDAALAALAAVVDASPAEQVPALASAHRVLRSTLDAIGNADPVR